MQNAFWKLIIIFGILGGCLWAVNPPEDRIRLGRDLSGGVSLVYSVRMPEGTDRAALLDQTIRVLSERVNPQGVLDISMTPLGSDRIEVVMPLPNEEVKRLGNAYRDRLDSFIEATEIKRSALERSLIDGTAVDRFGGGGDRGALVSDLQAAYDTARALQSELAAAVASSDSTAINTAKQAIADAEVESESLQEELLSLSLDRSRVVRVLELPNTHEVVRDETGDIVVGDDGRAVLRPSPREVALEQLAIEFPAAADGLDDIVEAWAGYQARRTGLDDPKDLMRLLQGAGVLDFHIGARPGSVEGVDVERLRSQLTEVGPDNTDSIIAKWFPIHDLQQWVDSPASLVALEADPVTYFSSNYRLVAAERDGQYYILLYTQPGKAMTHRADSTWSVEGTGRTIDQLGRPAISFRLDPNGGGLMSRLSQPNVGEPMAIVLDGKVYSAPNLNETISGSGVISGSFSPEELGYLMRVLAAGSLEARLSPEPIAVSVLGPSIGADNLTRGLEAFLWAVLVVGVFMFIWYLGAGLVADAALIFNGIIIFGVMAMMQGTFTLPGLAGVVLTMGMAVDANVLIYERIREELEAGARDLREAVRTAYQKVAGTILDANITNLIVCAVLLLMEPTTEVKGFALTLSIGIIATIFTALFVTRFLFDAYLFWIGGKRLPMLPSVIPSLGRLLHPNVDWVGLRGGFWTLSGIVILGSIWLFYSRGADMFDTEFRGGVAVTMQTGLAEDGTRIQLWQDGEGSVTERVRALADRAGTDDSLQSRIFRELRGATVLTVGDAATDATGRTVGDSFQVKVAAPSGLSSEEGIQSTVEAALLEEFGDQLDISPARTFSGHEGGKWAERTAQIDADTIGEVLGIGATVADVSDYRGGIVILGERINPPITLAEVEQRIDRIRQDPDFSDTVGRDVLVAGVEPAGDDTWSSIAVAVLDPELNYLRHEAGLVDERLAEREWELIAEALARQSSFQQVSSFAPAVAATRTANAIGAVVLSLAGILFYIWVRFGSLRYSIAAIAALCHDVIIVVGFLALTGAIAGHSFASGSLLIEEFQIDTGIVAALLTVIGYSLNDTIVILDRIRENRGKRPIPSRECVNRSINQAFSRTILTSVTTLIAVLIIYVFGGTGIRGFAFALVVGVVVGTYSSVAIASPLVFRRSDQKRRGELDVVEADPDESIAAGGAPA
ncbi:MAG: protein translocase subunit SecD [Planctomycetes bacterium]|nr:protein translocase subunit SecD [Planctomycetota bacterium]MCP4838697.1 protein translocase subunit SecD [Planctomycetota bacterium]